MGDIKIGRIPLGSMGTNCYFVYREDVKDAIVFDPGDSGGEKLRRLASRVGIDGRTADLALLALYVGTSVNRVAVCVEETA